MAVAPVLPWRKATGETLRDPAVLAGVVRRRRHRWSPCCSANGGWRRCSPSASAASPAGPPLARSCWPPAGKGGEVFVGRTNGGMIVHLGVVIIAVAFAASGSYVQQAEFTLEEGESATFAGHTFTFEGIRTEELANRLVVQADVRIDDGPVYRPAVNQYFNTGRQIQTPSVYSTATEDLSLSLLVVPEQAGDPVVLRVTVQPLIVWLWIGGTVMVLGALLAAWPRRRRTDPSPAPTGHPRNPRRMATRTDGITGRAMRLRLRPMPEPAGAGPDAATGDPDAAPGEPPAGRLALWIAAAVGVLSLGLIVVLATADGGGGGVDTELVGEVAPLVAGETLDGEIYDLDERRGRWVLVNFFQTTCIPCVREHPELIEFSERHARAGDAEVVSVVFDDTTTAVEEFFTEFGGDWPVVVGDTGTIALDYGVIAVPESYLVAPSGVVAWKGVGGVTADGLDDVIASLTGEAA